MLSIITKNLKAQEYDRDSYDLNRAAAHIAKITQNNSAKDSQKKKVNNIK